MSSIAVAEADNTEVDLDSETADEATLDPDTETEAAISNEPDPDIPDENGTVYQTTAMYTGTLSKLSVVKRYR